MRALLLQSASHLDATLESALADRVESLIVAREPDEAWQVFGREQPRLLIVDYRAGSGLAGFLSRIQSSGRRSEIALLAIVGAEQAADISDQVDDFWVAGTDHRVIASRLKLSERRLVAASERKEALNTVQKAHANLMALIENIDDFVLFSDQHASPIFFNSAYAAVMKELLGVEMAPGIRPHERLPDAKAREVWEEYHRRVLSGERFCVEYPHLHHDGEQLYFEVSYNPVWKDGAVIGFSEFTRDVTARKRQEQALLDARADLESKVVERTAELAASNRALKAEVNSRLEAEEALHRSEELYRSVYTSAPLAFVQWDTEHRVVAWNQHAEEVFGWTEQQVLGRDFFDFMIPASEREAVRRVIDEMLNEATLRNHSTNQNQTRDGRTITVQWANAVQHDRKGKVASVISLGLDVTEQIRIQARVQQSEKLEAIGQLAGGIAHDFNNQLVGVLGFAELLAANVADEQLRSYARQIIRAASRSSQLISQLLAFARKNTFGGQLVDLHEVIHQVVTLLEHTLDKRITIQQDLRAAAALTRGDPVQLENALLNLALNARDAISGKGEIEFVTDIVQLDEAQLCTLPAESHADSYVRLLVRDSGEGFDPQISARIFEPFFTTKSNGTGMGLAAAYGTVRSHNGLIQVQSEPGRGTEFQIYLPRVLKASIVDPLLSGSVGEDRVARIMVVDDEPLVLDTLCDILASLGHQVTACSSGIESLDDYRENWRQIDLVILDVIMPGMDGHEVLAELRRINPGVRVILSSGYMLQSGAEASASPSVALLKKPYRIDRLTTLIQQVLGPELDP